MSKSEKPVIKLNENQLENDSKIEAIKNLIFGENIQAYDSEFEAIKDDILFKKKVLEDLIEEVKTDLNTAIDNVSTDLNVRMTALEEKLTDKFESLEEDQVSKKMLGKLLIDLGERVSTK